ncbi:hypothetical protein PybrP1_009597 [[Pythium] brassicae (nom. inval.)]|nr:hypothetical protein PybrP1_009597 [[Pythium] brassicae (nom. inval.)]
MSAAAAAAQLRASQESDVELMRTILGEHVPQSVILRCLSVCSFDVSAALNWYFMEVGAQETPAPASSAASANASASAEEDAPVVQSGLSLTLHSRFVAGMLSKTDGYYATLTRGIASYDMLTPSNEKFLTIRLRKRGWRSASLYGAAATQRPSFVNGDVVTLECNGLWLKAGQLNRVLQWKPPSEDDRNKFVVRGLPLGRSLRPGDYFFLTSFKWTDKEVVTRDERPVGLSSYDTSAHRCFLGLERIRHPDQRLYFYAKLTEKAIETLPQPKDTVDLNHVTINVAGTPLAAQEAVNLHDVSREQLSRQDSISEEIVVNDAKVDQMASIIGNDVPRDRLATVLDGAGGDVQVALEHYFMSQASSVESAPTPELVFAEPRGVAQVHAAPPLSQQRPLSELLLPIPSLNEPIESPGITQLTAGMFDLVQASPVPSGLGDSVDGRASAASLSFRSARCESVDDSWADASSVHSDGSSEHEALTIHDFEMLSVLGKGSFGAVMLVRFKKDGRVFALKIIKKTNMDRTDVLNAMEERQILQRIHHPYICSLVFAFQTNERLYLGMKYYAAGDLFYHLNMRGKIDLRDALAQNVDGSRNYGKAYDWWSLGVVIYEMLVGESPFYDENEHKMLSRIAYADVVFPKEFPKDAYELVRGLLTKDPYHRLGSADMGGADAVKANAFFKSIDWELLERREVNARWKPKLASETDTRYVDPEFIDEGPPSAAYDPSVGAKKSHSKRFSQFSFNYSLR